MKKKLELQKLKGFRVDLGLVKVLIGWKSLSQKGAHKTN